MSSFDFITENIKYSYSSVSTFETCNHAFYLTYIMCEDRSFNSAYGQFGSFVHLCLEKYFKNELKISELSNFYRKHYCEYVTMPFPAFHKNANETYFNNGLNFFDNFEFDKSEYEILIIEDSISAEYNGIKLVVKPDLVLKELSTGKIYLIDFKTANGYKNDKLDKQKMIGYLRQFYLYCYFIWLQKNISVDEIHIWFVINDKIEKIIFDPVKAQENLEWFIDVIENIKNEEEFKANNKNKFFCDNLCSVSANCNFK
jgi:hypothetical protein